MKVGNFLRSRLVGLIIAPRMRRLARRYAELRRRLLRRTHRVSAFLEIDDPYSYLLSRFLPDLAAGYEIDLDVHLVSAPIAGFRPRPDLLADYAALDCRRMAQELGLPFLDRGSAPPVEHQRALADAVAAADAMTDMLPAIEEYWRGDAERIRRRVENDRQEGASRAVLEENRQLLGRLGHYNSATLYYGGEWYWGIDRLHYLTERLEELGLRRPTVATDPGRSLTDAMRVSLPATPPAAARDLEGLELFFSFRSPYSYLVLPRAFAIADAFGMSLRLRPVLPMIMRGMQVPRPKLLYIVRDAAREAERLGMPFGRFWDPAGAGVERCIAVFCHADAAGRGREFARIATEAIWAQGIDLESDDGMRDVASRAGLAWPGVKKAMRHDAWRNVANRNRDSMMALGAWGVPTLRVGDFVAWGQDRDWLLVRHLERRTAITRKVGK